MKISHFVAQELLYEYATNSLDHLRQKAVEEALKNSPDLSEELTIIQNGIRYCDGLSQIEPSPDFLEELKNPKTYFSEVLHNIHFQSWPSWAKWISEALFVGSLVTLAISFIPWTILIEQIQQKNVRSVVVSEVNRPKAYSTFSEPSGDQKSVAAKEPLFVDEEKGPQQLAEATTSPLPEKTEPANSSSPNEKSTAAVEETTGLLYRGTLHTSNLEASSPKIVALIESFGGRKAGQVDLGWKREADRYFHFTIPSAKYDELLTKLRQYGALKISKEKHERVMPQGINRLIITVMEASPSSAP